MNPRLVQRFITAHDSQESGRLGEAGRTHAGNLQELLPAAKRPMLLSIVHQLAGNQLVESGDVAQQRNTGGVQLDTDVVDTRLDDRLQRLLEPLPLNIVLIKADTDILGIDLDQLAERVLQAPADRNGAAQRDID